MPLRSSSRPCRRRARRPSRTSRCSRRRFPTSASRTRSSRRTASSSTSAASTSSNRARSACRWWSTRSRTASSRRCSSAASSDRQAGRAGGLSPSTGRAGPRPVTCGARVAGGGRGADHRQRRRARRELRPDRPRPHPDLRHHGLSELRARPDVHDRRLRGVLCLRDLRPELLRRPGRLRAHAVRHRRAVRDGCSSAGCCASPPARRTACCSRSARRCCSRTWR